MTHPEKKKQAVWSRLVSEGFAATRAEAERLVGAGLVRINGAPVSKAGEVVASNVSLTVEQSKRFVSRGGLKLERALERFSIDVTGRECADVGSSTGGFTDVMLQRGASRVAAIDVGYGELDWKLRSDPRVVVMERTNVRDLTELPFVPSLVTIDVSFISLRLVLPVVGGWLKNGGECVALVKPQFEASRDLVEDGGLVTDPAVHRSVLTQAVETGLSLGFSVGGVCVSPIRGATGNKEFLMHLFIGPDRGILPVFDTNAAIIEAVDEVIEGDPNFLPNT
jgi:23S rRNA (cytidine1920-2'-O)/16S rRNA (cytidine1409-2'-O)-methyltransferase